jgi:hypothetical protein
LLGLGWCCQTATGTGITSVVGTVTIAANTVGVFDGGAFLIPGIDGFVTGVVEDTTATFSTASFTVAPEPGTVLFVGTGLIGLAIGRKRLHQRPSPHWYATATPLCSSAPYRGYLSERPFSVLERKQQ